jgi:hypothetical protein
VPRIERKARNQELFRHVNEAIAKVSAGFEVGTQEFICECAHTGCTAQLTVPAEVYARVRDDPARFLVLRGHEDRVHEVVVEDLGECLIVQAAPEETAEVAVST